MSFASSALDVLVEEVTDRLVGLDEAVDVEQSAVQWRPRIVIEASQTVESAVD